MPDARWGDSRDGLMHDLDLPRGEDRELVVDRVRAYELNSFQCSTVTRECRIRPLLCGRTYTTVPLFWTS
jgi:hypothetical protein